MSKLSPDCSRESHFLVNQLVFAHFTVARKLLVRIVASRPEAVEIYCEWERTAIITRIFSY